jgi:hypothetical protein
MPGIKRATTITFDDFFRLSVGQIYDFYDFGINAYEQRAKKLSALWRKRSEERASGEIREGLIEDSMMVRELRRQLGRAVTVMLYSEFEQALAAANKKLGMTQKKLNAWYQAWYLETFACKPQGVPLLEASAKLYEVQLDLNFTTGVAPVRRASEFLPGYLHLDLEVIDYCRLKDFAWARNQIAHKRGRATREQAREHHVLVVGDIEDEGGTPSRRRLPMDLRKEWVEMATQHLIAFVDSVAQALRVRERPDSAVSQSLL